MVVSFRLRAILCILGILEAPEPLRDKGSRTGERRVSVRGSQKAYRGLERAGNVFVPGEGIGAVRGNPRGSEGYVLSRRVVLYVRVCQPL